MCEKNSAKTAPVVAIDRACDCYAHNLEKMLCGNDQDFFIFILNVVYAPITFLKMKTAG